MICDLDPGLVVTVLPEERVAITGFFSLPGFTTKKYTSTNAATLVAAEPMLTLGKVRFNKYDSSSSIETMWVRNKLAFENETFEQMALEMERWYNVSFHIKNEQIKKLHFRGVFENKSLGEVLEALSYSRQFHYEIKDGKVTVW